MDLIILRDSYQLGLKKTQKVIVRINRKLIVKKFDPEKMIYCHFIVIEREKKLANNY